MNSSGEVLTDKEEILQNLQILHSRMLTVERVFDSTLTVLFDKKIISQEEVQARILEDAANRHAEPTD